jgi:Zn-dependent protease
MEETAYYGAIAALIAFGLLAGNRWARSMGHAVLLGLVGTTVAVAAFFCLIVVFAILSPDGLDPRATAVRLGALLLFGSGVGVVAAIGGRRRAEKVAARLF